MNPEAPGLRTFLSRFLLILVFSISPTNSPAAQLVDDFEYGLPFTVFSSPLTNHGWTVVSGGGRDLVSIRPDGNRNSTRRAQALDGGRISRVASLSGRTEPGFAAEFDLIIPGIVDPGNVALTLAAGSVNSPITGVSFGITNPGPITNEASFFFIETATRNWTVPAFPVGGAFRVRLLMNPKAYDGDGAGWLQLGTEVTGGNWFPIKGLEGVPLGFRRAGAVPPATWNSIVLDMPRFVGIDNIAVGDDVIVKLRGLEVTQGTQDLRNSVPLVAGKRTFVRAYVEAPEGEGGGSVIAARLRGFRNGVELPGSPLPRFLTGSPAEREPYLVPATGDGLQARNFFYQSINFLLPENWATNQLELRLDSDAVIQCETSGDGTCPVQVQFQEVPPMQIRLIPITTTVSGIPIDIDDGDIFDLIKSIRAMYPASTFAFSTGPAMTANLDIQAERSLSPLLNRLDTVWQSEPTAANKREIFYGVLPLVGVSDGLMGQGRIGGNVAAGRVNHPANDYPSRIFEHEIGHVLGRQHAVDHTQGTNANGDSFGYCGEIADATAERFPFFFQMPSGSVQATLGPLDTGETNLVFGLSALHVEAAQAGVTVEPVFVPTVDVELMSYCDVDTRTEPWPSSHTWQRLLAAIQGRYGATAANSVLHRAAAPSDYLLVRGTVNRLNSAVTFFPALHSIRTTPPPGRPGALRCQVLDGGGQVISETSFATQPNSEPGPDEAFSLLAPSNGSARQIRILKEGQVIGTLAASVNAPTVQLLTPNGGQTISAGPVLVSWTAFDSDDDPLSALIQYSADGGISWRTLASDLQGTSFPVAQSDLPSSTNAIFRVTVTDGFHSATDQSDQPSEMPNHAPRPMILTPASGANHFGDSTLVFEGMALDVDEGVLSAERLEWKSNLQGLLGVGTRLEVLPAHLAPGEHRITLTAHDVGGLSATATSVVTVVPFTRPWLEASINATNNLFDLRVHGSSGTKLILETSTNLVQWTPWQTIVQTNRSMLFSAAPPATGNQFFRPRTESLPIQIAQQPASTAALLFGQVQLGVEALGAHLNYQWYFEGAVLTNATNATLTLNDPQPAQSGGYFVVVTNFTGSVTSSVSYVTILSSVMEHVYSFGTNTSDGVNGWGPLTFGTDGWLYGCTRNGGTAVGGVAFKVRPNGSNYTVLRRFQSATDGSTPLGGLFEASNGRLYGTTTLGGSNNVGTIFGISKDGSSFTVLHHFLSTNDCRNPQSELIEASDGRLYGTAYNGGGFGRGGVFSLNKDGSDYQIVTGFNFGGAQAPAQPIGGLVQTLDGFLYGTTELGGLSNKGTIFRIATNESTNSVLKSLGLVADGAANPEGTLLLASDGFLYGTTYAGGSSNLGAIFKISADGSFFSVIASMEGQPDGAEPRPGLTEAPNGQMLGTTRVGGAANQGVLYRLNRNGSGLETLRHLGFGGNPGARSRSRLLRAPGDVFYGMTFGGGFNDRGTIFRYYLPELIP
jgi:uncharacterized repeat protein (TIGR03803 family)